MESLRSKKEQITKNSKDSLKTNFQFPKQKFDGSKTISLKKYIENCLHDQNLGLCAKEVDEK